MAASCSSRRLPRLGHEQRRDGLSSCLSRHARRAARTIVPRPGSRPSRATRWLSALRTGARRSTHRLAPAGKERQQTGRPTRRASSPATTSRRSSSSSGERRGFSGRAWLVCNAHEPLLAVIGGVQPVRIHGPSRSAGTPSMGRATSASPRPETASRGCPSAPEPRHRGSGSPHSETRLHLRPVRRVLRGCWATSS